MDVFSEELARAVLAAITKADRPAKFLSAAEGVTSIALATDDGLAYCEDEEKTIARQKVSAKQRDYVTRVFEALAEGLRYERFTARDWSRHSNPGLIKTIARVARKRCPD